MNFFEAQELARKRTRLMVVLFGMAVLSIAAALYGVVVYLTGLRGRGRAKETKLALYERKQAGCGKQPTQSGN